MKNGAKRTATVMVLALLGIASTAAESSGEDVVKLPVEFRVHNVNGSVAFIATIHNWLAARGL